MTKEGIKIENCMTPGAGVLALVRGHTSSVVMMTKEGSTQNCKFPDSRDRGSCAGT